MPINKLCEYCGNIFECNKNTPYQKFCSTKCCSKSYYNKKKEKYKERYKENKEVYRERNKIFRKNNPEKYAIYCKRWRKKHPGKHKESNKKWYENNKEKCRKKSAQYQRVNKDKIKPKKKEYRKRQDVKKRIKEVGNTWKINNKDKMSKWHKNYYHTKQKDDPIYKIKRQIRTRVSELMKTNGRKKDIKTEEILGISYEKFKVYLESLFKKGMSWENYGGKRFNSDGSRRGCWEIDHIIAISNASTKEQIYKLNNHTNLQPLWWWENAEKGKKDGKNMVISNK
jgi:hypothetical protein